MNVPPSDPKEELEFLQKIVDFKHLMKSALVEDEDYSETEGCIICKSLTCLMVQIPNNLLCHTKYVLHSDSNSLEVLE